MRHSALGALLGARGASAYQFQAGVPDLTANWDNTLQYTVLDGVKSTDSTRTALPNVGGSDWNFHRGIVSIE